MPNISVVTLGCPKNEVLSRRVKALLAARGCRVSDDPQSGEVIIVNTCGFIDAAKEESIEVLLESARLKESGSCRAIIAFGCLAQLHGDELSRLLPEVDAFVGLDELERLPRLAAEAAGGVFTDTVKSESVKTGAAEVIQAGRPWAYLQISDGCSRGCSFCVIPRIKGPYRSRPAAEIMAEAEQLAAGGVRELILIGQDTGVYGRDLDRLDLVALIRGLSRLPGVRRLRLMYLHPDTLSRELLAEFKNNEKLCRYLEMPFQHVDRKILASMRRGGDGREYRRLCELLREAAPDIALRTEFIVGYPGEDRAAFQCLLDFVYEVKPDYVGVFKFSPQEGTAAARLRPRPAAATVDKRYNRLRELADEIGVAKKSAMVGGEYQVLIEAKTGPDRRRGRLAGQAPEIDGEVEVRGRAEVGETVKVKITKAAGYDLTGSIKREA